jgi:hypothetical protein
MCGALPQLAVVVQGLQRCTTFYSCFVLCRYNFFFLCYVATFYVGLMIHTHICQTRAVWQVALTLSVNEMPES